MIQSSAAVVWDSHTTYIHNNPYNTANHKSCLSLHGE